MSTLIWALLSLLLGLFLVGIEFLIPSGGILGFLAATSLLIALWLAFTHSIPVFIAFMGAVSIGVPVVVLAALHFLPRTALGKRILLGAPDSSEVVPTAETWGGLQSLIGHYGTTTSKMLPSGAVEIEGRFVDAISPGMAIEQGQLVKVIEVRGNRVLVIPVRREDVEKQKQVAKDDAQEKAKEEDDPLSQPIESLGIDPFDNPFT